MNNISAISLDQECLTSFLNLHVYFSYFEQYTGNTPQ